MATKKKKKKAPPPAKKKAKKKVVAKAKAAPKKNKKAAAKKPAAKKTATKKKAPKKADVLPTPAEEARFWSLLEDAWATQGEEVNAARHALATRKPGSDEEDTELVDDALDAVIENLRAAFEFEDFPQEELVAMDRVLERKIYEVDRKDVHDVTDGSDDGFLYCRGYIVALGKEFFDAVNANGKMAIEDAECEEMCYLPAHIYAERFGDGEFPETDSGICRESFNNGDGKWVD